MGDINLVAAGSLAVAMKGKKLYRLSDAGDIYGNGSVTVPQIVAEGVVL